MKTKLKENQQNIFAKPIRHTIHNYYFHSDDDFREDRTWGKNSGAERQQKGKAKNTSAQTL